jgi:hypothetical protein
MKLNKKKHPALSRILADAAPGGDETPTQAVVDGKAAADCAQYILDSESEDYYQWCQDEGKDPQDLSNPHIYTSALKAFGMKAEPGEPAEPGADDEGNTSGEPEAPTE